MKLDIQGISFNYNSIPVLQDVGMRVEVGELVALLGPNGSGKTTLLKCIAKMLKPRRGAVMVGGQRLEKLDSREVARLLGYVPQSANNVFPCSVFDAVLIGRRPRMAWGVRREDRVMVSHALEMMGLQHMANRSFNQISAGEQQKVLIARALAQEPDVLLLDEPTSNLDLKHQLEVLSTLRKVTREKGVSALIAIHDLNLASRFSDQIVFLKDGIVCDTGEPGHVLTTENIRSVYGVEAAITEHSGRPHVIAIGSVEQR